MQLEDDTVRQLPLLIFFLLVTVSAFGQAGQGQNGSQPPGTTISVSDITLPGNVRIKGGDPWFDVTAYGASGSAQATAATAVITSGSATITIPTPLDFKNGHGIYIQDNNTGKSVGPNGTLFCSTIVSGGGTTTLVLSSAPSVSTSLGLVSHDDTAAEQAAIDASEAITNPVTVQSGRTVWWPDGTYHNTCVPLHSHNSGAGVPKTRWRGAGRGAVTLNSASNIDYGIGVLFADKLANMGPSASGFTATALLTGTGNAYSVTATSNSLGLDLRQCQNFCGDINGLAAFTAEATFKPTAVTQNASILVSSGTRDSVDGYRSAFALAHTSGGALQCKLNTSVSGTVTITGAAGAITANNTYHVALSYDGSNLRCFLNGTQVTGSPTAQTGTVVQSDFEEVRTNGDMNYFPDGAILLYSAIAGTMDGIRLSNNARYTANFTAPTAKWGTSDANTWIQVNFDNQQDNFTVGTYGAQALPVFLFLTGACGTNVLGADLDISGMTFSFTGGEYLSGLPNTTHISDTAFNTIHNGLFLHGCSYNGKFDHVDIQNTQGAGRYGIVAPIGIMTYDSLLLGGGDTVNGIFGGNATFNALHMNGVGNTLVYPLIFRGAGQATIGGVTPTAILNFTDSDFEETHTAMKATVLLDQMSGVLNGGDYECNSANTTCQALAVNGQAGVQGLVLNGSGLSAASTAASLVHVTGNPVNIFNNVQNKAGGSVGLTDGGTIIVCGGTGTGSSAGCQFPAGLASAPSMSIAGSGTGVWSRGNGFWDLETGGTTFKEWNGSASEKLGSGTPNCWSSANDPSASSPDTCFSRESANVVDVGNAQGDKSGTLKATSLQTPTGNVSGVWNCINITPVTTSGGAVTTDQNMQACTIPAGTLNLVGKTLKIHTAGVYTTAAASSAAMTIEAKLCTVSGCSSGTVVDLCDITSSALGALTISNNTWELDCVASTQTAGVSSVYERSGKLAIDLVVSNVAPDTVFLDANATAVTAPTIDNTVQLFLQISGAFSAASASNVFTGRSLVVESIQ
jgi:hypothetical protein